MISCLGYFSTPCGHPSSEISMHHYHYWKRGTIFSCCCYRSWWLFQDLWYLKKRLLSNPLWKLIFGLLRWVTTRASYLWPALFMYMPLLDTLVISQIWLDRWTSSRATTISTTAALEVNLLQCLVNRLLNSHSICLQKWMLFLRLFLACSRFPLLLMDKIVVSTRKLLYKGLVCDEILWWYDTHVTHKRFFYKLRNLLVLLNLPNTGSGFRGILNEAIDVS